MKKQIRKPAKKSADQVSEFKRLARELECDESGKGFDAALKRIGQARAIKPAPKPKPKT